MLTHGITGEERATSITAINEDSILPTYVGTGPINMADITNINKPVLCYNLADAVAQIGYVTDHDNYTLCEAIDLHFRKFNVGPICLINVLNPDIHKQTFTNEQLALTGNNNYVIEKLGVILDSLVLPTGDNYSTQWSDDGYLVIIPASSTPSANISVTYDKLDPTLVDNDDIIGGIDANTGLSKGLECISDVFPKFRLVPNVIAAPKYSTSATVAAVLEAKASDINGVFMGMAFNDIDTTEVTKYQDAPSYKNNKNFDSTFLGTYWPKTALEKVQAHLSSQITASIQSLASESQGVPYQSPSNKSISADSTVLKDGTAILLGLDKANYLNDNGIGTAINWLGGWRSWGNRTTAYPANQDPKDMFIACRMMFNFLQNTLVQTFWDKVDNPMNLVLVKTVLDSVNIWLNGLVAQGYIIGGRVEFREEDNPLTSLINGKMTFHIYFTPAIPAEQIHFIKEIDVNYYSNLFAA